MFTARKRSLRRLCFYTCLSFCPQGGCLVPGGVWSRGGAWSQGGVWSWGVPGAGGVPGLGEGRPGPGGCLVETLSPPPPSGWLLLRAVRILLECILVSESICFYGSDKLFHGSVKITNRRQ